MIDPFIASIIMFGGSFAPVDWAFCIGTVLPVSDNPSLYSLLGDRFGGNGTTTFALPDFRGRVPLHYGKGPGLSNYYLGQRGGYENNILTVDQLPAHSHLVDTSQMTVNTSNLYVDGSNLNVDSSGLQGTVKVNGGPTSSKNGSGNNFGLASGNAFNSVAASDEMSSGNVTISGSANISGTASIGGSATISSQGTETGNTGSNASIENVQPYQAVSFIIALQGVYPPRS